MPGSITIIGAEQACACEHCGRKLKIGLRTDAMGTIGADCLIAAVSRNYKRFSTGKPSASFLRDIAVMRETKTPQYIRVNRGIPDSLFTYDLES